MTLFFLTFFTSEAGRATLTSAGARDRTAGGGMARTPSHAAPEPTHLGAGPQGGFPLLPLPVTQKGRWQPLPTGHVATSAWAPNLMAQWLLCPRAALTAAFTPRPNPRGLPTNHLGFSPILRSTAERGGEGEKKRKEWGTPPPRRAGKTEGPSWGGAGTARTGAVVLWERALCGTKRPELRGHRRREHLQRRRE
jgi:hypothetical protein